jgi:glucokinase
LSSAKATRLRKGTVVLIAAGTGLGEAILVWNGQDASLPMASEGGHSDFAARNEEEIELLRYLQKDSSSGRVSSERV